MPRFGLRLTPHGHLVAEDQDDAPEIDTAVGDRLAAAFAQGSGPGLVRLGAGEVGHTLPPVFVWWRSFATRYVGAVCLNASGREDDVTLPVGPASRCRRPCLPGADRPHDGRRGVSDRGGPASAVG